MEKQSTIRVMPQLPVKALRKELFAKYNDCKTLWIYLCKEYPSWTDEHIKTVFFRYIIEKTEKKDEPMYLNETTTSVFATVKYTNPPSWDCDCDECCDYDNDDDNEEEGNNPMNDQRNHLENRVYQITSAHETKLRADFHMNDDEAPGSFDELVARFKDGKVQIDKNVKTDRKFIYFPDMIRYITWRDPSVPADEAGYEAASKKLRDARTMVLDDVAILEPKDALASVRAFEEQKFN